MLRPALARGGFRAGLSLHVFLCSKCICVSAGEQQVTTAGLVRMLTRDRPSTFPAFWLWMMIRDADPALFFLADPEKGIAKIVVDLH